MKKEDIYRNLGLYWLKDFLFNDSTAMFIARIIVYTMYYFNHFLHFGLVFLGIYVLLANWMKTSETIFGKKIGYRYYRYKHFE